MCDFIYGILIGVGSAILAILIDRHIKNSDLSTSIWRYVRHEISTNSSIIDNWKTKIERENKFIEDHNVLLMQPLPPFRDEFWKMIISRMPENGLKNENLIHHLRLLSQNFEYLNNCSAERQNIRNQFGHEDVKKVNNIIIKSLNRAKFELEELDKQYSLVVRLEEDEKSILQGILKSDRNFRPINPSEI